jgi:hypothetical protein
VRRQHTVPLALRAIVQARECGLSVRDGSFGRIFLRRQKYCQPLNDDP